MKVKKTTEISCYSTEDCLIKEGDVVIFEVNGMSMVGVFSGISKRGSIAFRNLISNGVTKCYLPRSITRISILENIGDLSMLLTQIDAEGKAENKNE